MEVESIISLYDKNDRESSEFSSFIIKKIFSPITHIKQNDPVDVKSKNELLSFVDTMHDESIYTFIPDSMFEITLINVS